MLTAWRYRHALMVHRMLGIKMGTGGSSGFAYLRASAHRHKIFSDFSNLSTYLVSRDNRPPLPARLKRRLQFHFHVEAAGAAEEGKTGGEGGAEAEEVRRLKAELQQARGEISRLQVG